MIKEKHIVNKTYGNHQLARYIDVYEVSANRCHSVPESGYKGTEATLVDEPSWNEKFSSYSITGATLTGNNFVINNDVTAQAVYETAKNLTLQTDGHGTIAANRTSGFIGDQVTLSNTPSTGYDFTGYSITGAILTGNKFNFIGNDVTARAGFTGLPIGVLRVRTNDNQPPSSKYRTDYSVTAVPGTTDLFDVSCGDSFRQLFYGIKNIIEVVGGNTPNVTSMEYALAATNITAVNNLNTTNVTSMDGMFENCTALVTLPTGLNFDSVVDVRYMFNNCRYATNALAMYNIMKEAPNITRTGHSYTFAICGIDSTASGDLYNIPRDWGGFG